MSPCKFSIMQGDAVILYNKGLSECVAWVEAQPLDVDYDLLPLRQHTTIDPITGSVELVEIVPMNVAQMWGAWRKYQQNPDGSPCFRHFLSRVQEEHDWVYIQWCGMYLGIEKDGYTHS